MASVFSPPNPTEVELAVRDASGRGSLIVQRPDTQMSQTVYLSLVGLTQAWYYQRSLRHSQASLAGKGARFAGFLVLNLALSRTISAMATETALQSAQERNIQEEVFFKRIIRQGLNDGAKGVDRAHVYHTERYVNRKMDYGG